MDLLFSLLKDLLPIQVAILIVIFIYFLKLFKDIAEQFLNVSQKQIEYLKDRLDSLDKTTQIFDRTVQHQEKDLKRMYELNEQLKTKLTEEKDEKLARLDNQMADMLKELETIRSRKPSDEEVSKIREGTDKAKQTAEALYEFAISKLPVTTTATDASYPQRPLKSCFVIMPFHKELDEFLYVVRTALEEISIEAIRADSKVSNRPILATIQESIASSDFIVAGISDRNPNVMYELGFAHAIGKPVILLARNTRDIVFDISTYRVILYSIKTIEGRNRLKDTLQQTVQTLNEEIQKRRMEQVSALAVEMALAFIPGGSTLLQVLRTLK